MSWWDCGSHIDRLLNRINYNRLFEHLEENEELETLSKRDSPHLEKDSAFKPIRLLD